MHRDVSPSNLLIRPDGTAILSDFGVSKPLSGPAAETHTQAIKGKVHYFAPETLTRKVNDARTDLFSIGVTLFEAVTGEVPFGGDTIFVIYEQIVNGRRKPVTELRADCPKELVAIIDRLLETEADARFQNAVELLRALPPLPAAARLELGELVRAIGTRRRSEESRLDKDDPPAVPETAPLPDEDPAASSPDPEPAEPASSEDDAPAPQAVITAAPAAARAGVRPDLVRKFLFALAILVLVFAGSATFLFVLFSGDDPAPTARPSAPATSEAESTVASAGPETLSETDEPETDQTETDQTETESATEETDDEPEESSAAPEPPAEAEAPAEAETEPTPAQPRERPVRRRPIPESGPALAEAHQHLRRGDRGSAIRILAAEGRSPEERALLIDLYRSTGRTELMLRNMHSFVRRFPRAPQTPEFRREMRIYGWPPRRRTR